ncbi:MAG: hypothetical protein R6V77_06930 [Candidatus Cloacimonadaceae bacterium]
MKKTAFLMTFLLSLLAAFMLQAKDPNPLDEMLISPDKEPREIIVRDSLTNDIIRVNYEKKNAKLAMLMSSLVPGSGQFYANKSAITAYIFPIIEIAAIAGMIYYDNKGDKKVNDYKKYVTEDVTIEFDGYTYTGPRYYRPFQEAVQDTLISIHTLDIYDGVGYDKFFSLDPTDTQHFFEDIGKYNKYIFGWVDWYFKYAEIPSEYTGVPDPHPLFVFDITNPADPRFNSPENKWQYNLPLVGEPTQDLPYSALRKVYIQMRNDAEDEYRASHNITFGLVFNHIASALDAVRVTRNVNRYYLSDNGVKFNYYASVRDGRLTPMLGLNYTF